MDVLHHILSSLFIFISILAQGQSSHSSLHDGFTKMGAYSSGIADVFSISGNQASLADFEEFSAGIAGEKRFFIQDLADYRAIMVLPTSSGNFGGQLNYFGNLNYHEYAMGLAYARRMGKLDAGVQVNYQRFSARSYAGHNALTMEAGIIFQIVEKLRVGLHVYNPISLWLADKGIAEKGVYSAGFGYDASKNFFLGVVLEKTEDMPVNVVAGIHYNLHDRLFVRAGITGSTQSFFFGIGFTMNAFRFAVIASLHPHLGITPGTVILYQKQKQQ